MEMQNKAVFVGNNIGLYAKIYVITVGQRILEGNAQQKKIQEKYVFQNFIK